MTLFQVVKLVLDKLYSAAVARYGKKVDDVIRNRMDYLSENYRKLADPERKPIDYRDPATRFAYVYMYVAAHGDYIVQVLEHLQCDQDGRIFNEESLRVACVGGGPGSDVLAIVKYLNEQRVEETVERVRCYLLDAEQAWGDTWAELDDLMSSKVNVNTHFQRLDVTDPKCWEYSQGFFDADLFTMSYFVSEIYQLDQNGDVTKFWQELFERAKSGTLFLYVDNGSVEFNNYSHELFEESDLEEVIKKVNTWMWPRHSEQASELDEYREKFGKYPKLKTRITYQVFRKP